jgi:hypothetical protein
VGPRAVLDAVVKRKIPSPSRESNLEPDRPARSPALYRLSYRGSLLFYRVTYRNCATRAVCPARLNLADSVVKLLLLTSTDFN